MKKNIAYEVINEIKRNCIDIEDILEHDNMNALDVENILFEMEDHINMVRDVLGIE